MHVIQLLAGLTLLAQLSCLEALAADLILRTAPEFSTGRYGGTTATDVYSVPLDLTWREDRGWLRAKLPYLIITGPSNVVPEVGPLGSTAAGRSTDRGFGDVVLSASREVVTGLASVLDVSVATSVKLPTADASRGLGTGRADLDLQVDASIGLGPGLSLSGTIGRRFAGDPADIELRNVFFGSSDVTVDLTPGIAVGLSVNARERSSAGARAIIEAGLFADVDLSPTLTLSLQVYRGLTRDSADIGGGLGITRRLSF